MIIESGPVNKLKAHVRMMIRSMVADVIALSSHVALPLKRQYSSDLDLQTSAQHASFTLVQGIFQYHLFPKIPSPVFVSASYLYFPAS